jgi:hypothetical protein
MKPKEIISYIKELFQIFGKQILLKGVLIIEYIQ